MRRYSAGFVRKTERGRWQAVISWQEDGAQRRVTRMLDVRCSPDDESGAKAARRELSRWRERLVADERERCAEDGGGAPSVSVADWCERCVATLEGGGAIERSTAYDYRRCLMKLGVDGLGDVPLGELGPRAVQAWEASLLASGLSPVTVGKCHRVLRRCMRLAEEWGDLDRDPTRGVRPPRRPTRAPNALDAEGRARVASVIAAGDPTPLLTAAALALMGGLRDGECCGLRWSDVDLAGRVLWVHRSIGRDGGSTYVKEPKAGRRRDVPLAPQLAAQLARRREAMRADCEVVMVPFEPALYVIGSVDGRHRDPSCVSHDWSSLARQLGFRGVTGQFATFHDLRHTFATMAIANGVDVKTVSSILGHANAAMTLNVYASADPDAKRAAADVIGDALG